MGEEGRLARVLVVSFSVVPGPDRHGVQLLHALRALASRFVVDVLTLRVGDLAHVERFQKTRMLRVPIPDGPLGDQVEAFRRALRRQLEGAEYDVVHFRDAWSGIPVIERRRELGLKTVFDVGRAAMGEPSPADLKLLAELARDEDVCCQHADLVLAPTEVGRRFLAAKGGAERFVVVPPGVDVDRFDAELSDVGGPPRILYAGSIAPGRGVRVLLRAFRDVLQRMPARLLLAGPMDPAFAEPLESAIAQLDLRGQVELHGPVDNEDMPRVIARATVCVAPWAADHVQRPTACFPTKILEYMACRRATIAPRRSTVLEVVQDGIDGLLFEPGVPEDLADKLLRVLGDVSLRERLAEAGQRRVRERYPASATRRRLLEAYTRILPATSWLPIGQAPAPVAVLQTRPGLSSGVDVAEVTHDTNPALGDDAFAGGAPTAITGAPLLLLEDTQQVTVAEVAIPDAEPEAEPDEPEPPEPAPEPWRVVEGTAPRTARPLARQDTDGTPAEGTAVDPTPSLGVSFVAGELEVPSAPRPAKMLPADTEETVLTEDSFVAAGDLLANPPASRDRAPAAAAASAAVTPAGVASAAVTPAGVASAAVTAPTATAPTATAPPAGAPTAAAPAAPRDRDP